MPDPDSICHHKELTGSPLVSKDSAWHIESAHNIPQIPHISLASLFSHILLRYTCHTQWRHNKSTLGFKASHWSWGHALPSCSSPCLCCHISYVIENGEQHLRSLERPTTCGLTMTALLKQVQTICLNVSDSAQHTGWQSMPTIVQVAGHTCTNALIPQARSVPYLPAWNFSLYHNCYCAHYCLRRLPVRDDSVIYCLTTVNRLTISCDYQ